MRLGWVLISALFFLVALRMQACDGCLEKERTGLLEIKAYFLALGDGYGEWELGSWVEDRGSNCCAWERVKCSNISTGHVTDLSLMCLLPVSDIDEKTWMLNVSLLRPFEELLSLDLSENNFKGWSNNEGFPWLKKLETLDLRNNALNGSILPSFSGLTSLRTLCLGDNKINDSFPAQGFPRLEKLQTLDLSYNQLNGSICGELNGLTSLRMLMLMANEIPSLSPQDFVNFTQLELLDLSQNLLGGSLNAKDLQNFSNLTMLDLSDNKLNSSIEGLCEMKNLVELDLSSNMFSGQLPKCLSILTNLQLLDLSNNSFSGNFPSFIRNLTSLVHLSLFGNYLEGSFSLSTLANHSKLQVLYISSQSPKAQVDTEKTQWFPTFQLRCLLIQSCNLNMNKGIIPSFLLYQRDLQLIDLSHNKLRGAFPNWLIQNNSRLETFFIKNNSLEGKIQLYSIKQDMFLMDVSNNKISGSLPKDFGAFLRNIQALNLSMNDFEGGIPASIGKMKELGILDLSNNHLSGVLPEELAAGCIDLQILKLSNNFLHGNVPTSFKSKQLEMLYLNNNNFSGTLDEVLANNTNLFALDISNNSISGAIPSSIGKFVFIEILLMAENKLEGKIPLEFSNMSFLIIVDLSQNKLSGPIEYFNSSSLKYLYLQKNVLSGHMPLALTENSQLVVLDLRDNNFSGNVPSWMHKLSKLRILLLGGNKFHGQIPIQLCNLKHVTIMDLSRNMIHGTIPSCFTNLSFGMEHVDDDGGDFQHRSISSGEIYPDVYTNASLSVFSPITEFWYGEAIAIAEFRTKSNYYSYQGSILENMTGLDLSCNELRGNIPFQIGNLQQIHALNLSHNYLSGSIPETFSNLKQIESLDLSFNNLSGQIPFELAQLNFLSNFNVSYNNLSGIAPSAGQFATFDEESYKGNPGLCGPLLKHKCDEGFVISPPSQFNNTEEKDIIVDMVAFGWSFVASYITILLGFVTVLCINPQWRMAWFHYIGKLIHTCFPTFPLY